MQAMDYSVSMLLLATHPLFLRYEYWRIDDAPSRPSRRHADEQEHKCSRERSTVCP